MIFITNIPCLHKVFRKYPKFDEVISLENIPFLDIYTAALFVNDNRTYEIPLVSI